MPSKLTQHCAALEWWRMPPSLPRGFKALRGNPGYLVDYAIFEQQDHGISPWPALGRGISFAFTDGP